MGKDAKEKLRGYALLYYQVNQGLKNQAQFEAQLYHLVEKLIIFTKRSHKIEQGDGYES